MKAKDGDTNKEAQVAMKRFAGLSLIPASQFVVRVSQLFAFPSSAFSVLQLSPLRTALFTTTDMSVAAWARATYQYHVNGTDTVGWSVGRSVGRCTCSRRPR